MITENILAYLQKLSANNNREWFHANKAEYDTVKIEFETLIDLLISGISGFDKDITGLTAKECIFRIFRDVRFSKNKLPCKTNFGGYIAKNGRKGGYAGYYFHIEPEKSFVAGGLWCPGSPRLKAVRTEIFENTQEFKKIIEKKSFQQRFGQIEGEKLKMAPKGFPKDWSDIELLKFKSFNTVRYLKDSELMEDNFVETILKDFKTMYDFNHYLNIALEKVQE